MAEQVTVQAYEPDNPEAAGDQVSMFTSYAGSVGGQTAAIAASRELYMDVTVVESLGKKGQAVLAFMGYKATMATAEIAVRPAVN